MTVYLDSIFSRLQTERLLWKAFEWGAVQGEILSQKEEISSFSNLISSAPKYYFLIPLISRSKAKDWAVVSHLLKVTVASLISQTNPNWEAIVCGQNTPDFELSDSRITFLKFHELEQSENKFDKFEKLEQVVDHIKAKQPCDGFLHVLDADDVLHKDFVSFALRHPNVNGFIINKGYMLAPSGQNGRYLAPREITKLRLVSDTLANSCGSCMSCYFDTREDGIEFRLFHALAKQSHGWFEHLAILLGRPLISVPFPALIYNVLHGNNDYGGRTQPPKLAVKHLNYISDYFTTSPIS